MSLLEQIEKLWTEEQEAKSRRWVEELIDSRERLIAAGKKFHQWAPLHVYLSVAQAQKPQVSFSLRYQGQNVAALVVNDAPELRIDKQTAKTNQSYFGVTTEGTFSWRGRGAATFRANFRKVPSDRRGRISEHRIESEFLKQMSNRTSKKFSGTLKGIQPVLLANCPFQLPLPISGNTGKPETGKGSIDIVARRRVGNQIRISIWELKSPGVTAHAIEQAYIYGVTLIKMLRSNESGKLWYRDVFGFTGKMPNKLTVECVVAVSLPERSKPAFAEKLRRFVKENSLQVGIDTIKLYVAHYSEDPLRVCLLEECSQ